MEMKYAPRPWTYSQGDRNNPHNGRVTAANGKLLVLRATMNPDEQDVMRLFSAAPELLVALEAIEAHCATGARDTAEGQRIREQSRAAIAKATTP